MKEKKDFDYFDRPETIKKLWILLIVICGLTIVPDFFLHRFAQVRFQDFPGFYAILGFLSCAALILFSKMLGLVLKVEEDYYDG